MNTIPRPSSPQIQSLPPSTVSPPGAPRRDYRERDFGVGYGRSSGYASQRQYVKGWNGQPRFRFG
jgi:hypothetical protein